MTTRGLTLGKYAPLHRGHQHVIETALKVVDELIVLIYDCPETTDVPLPVRAGWIKYLYPDVRVILGWNGPLETGPDPRIAKIQQNYVKSVITEPITHFFSSEFYGDHMSKALRAIDYRVDEKRKKFPISATDIRKDPFKYRDFVSDIVYHDLIKKIVFLGAESTGKTTITMALADRLKTQYTPEYGREYWMEHQVNGKLTLEQLVEIARGHLIREEFLLYAKGCNRYLFVDSNALTTAMFSKFYHRKVHPELQQLATRAETRYDHVFLCGTDIPYVEDGTRSGASHRLKFQQQIIDDLKKRRIEYTVLKGNLEMRIAKVLDTIEHRVYGEATL